MIICTDFKIAIRFEDIITKSREVLMDKLHTVQWNVILMDFVINICIQ